MSIPTKPAAVAALLAACAATAFFVPFVAREYRLRGELRISALAAAFAALLYAAGLLAYVLLPLPPAVPGSCTELSFFRNPQWIPFTGLRSAAWPWSWAELAALVSDTGVQQFAFNIALFVPMGLFVRHLRRCGIGAMVLTGFAVSLTVELTQLTGIWFVYPCPYRLFDVDDLIANTTGTLVGGLLAPALRLFPGRRTDVPTTAPCRVTASRYCLGMCCELILLWCLGNASAWVVKLTAGDLALPAPERDWWESVVLWFCPAVLLLLATFGEDGTPLGEHAVRLRAMTPEGRRPGPAAVIRHWLAGSGGFALAQGVAHASPLPATPLALLWCALHVASVTSSFDRRGINGRPARLTIVDARQDRAPPLPGLRMRSTPPATACKG